MVSTEHTTLPEICDVAWHLLRTGHTDCVTGQLRKSLLIGFIIALALKGLVDPDCLVLPAPSAPGVAVRLRTMSNSKGVRLDSLESQLVLVQAAVASFEVNSEARSDVLKTRLLAALSALFDSQQHSHPLLQPDPALTSAASTTRSASANLADMHSSGSDDSFSGDEFSEYEDSLAVADLQSRVSVSPSSSSFSYAALVYRIRQEYASKSNQSKARSLLFTELAKGPRCPTAGLATMMSAPWDGWLSSYAQFPGG